MPQSPLQARTASGACRSLARERASISSGRAQLRRPARGLTLVELVVTLAILAALASAGLSLLGGSSRQRKLEALAAELAADLRAARTEAVLRNDSVSFTVNSSAAGSCYVVHTGPANACDCLAGPQAHASLCASGAQDIKTIRLPAGAMSLQANVATMTFDPVNGTTTPAGTLSLIGMRGETIRHIVNVMGRVRSCVTASTEAVAPALKRMGYPACAA